MSLVFYMSPLSSASPVQHALAELDLPHEVVVLDLKVNQQRQPEFLALNPNGKVPTLVVDGTPMFEALAIILWLGENHGVQRGLWPTADSPERLEAMAWATWAYVSFASWVRLFNVGGSPQFPAAVHHAPQRELALKEVRDLLEVLDGRLRDRAFIVGDSFSLADVALGNSVTWAAFSGVPVQEYPNVQRWLTAFQARPTFGQVWAPPSAAQ